MKLERFRIKKVCLLHACLCLLFFVNNAMTQAGINVQAGVIMGYNQDIMITPKGTAHYGYRIGMDARVGSSKTHFLPGLYYSKMSFFPSKKMDFLNDNPSLHILKGRFGLGFLLNRPENTIRFRGRLQGSISYIDKIEDGVELPSSYKKLNEAFAGLDLGFGIDFGFISLDIEREFGLVNLVFEEPNTKLNVWCLSIGLFF